MTAADYKKRYRNMMVAIVNDKEERTGWQPVDINRYLLSRKDSKTGEPEHYNISDSKRGMWTLYSKLQSHFAKKGATLKVYIAGAELEEKVLQSFNEAWYYSKKAYWGKASPEEAQITLQLVMRFEISTPPNLQDYCDEKTDRLAQGRIGLDCNGFVGNYIEHGLKGKPWDNHKAGDENFEANADIATIMSRMGPEVKTLDDINEGATYIMGLIDPLTRQVIPQESNGKTGHIVITTPFTTVTMNGNGSKKEIKMKVVESTLDAGLTESDYQVVSGKDFVFTVSRGSKKGTAVEFMDVRMRPVR
jgi:hypothetical protein